MKLYRLNGWEKCLLSRLARALWIEITVSSLCAVYNESRLARALWIEMTPAAANLQFWRSRLARALWIEIIAYIVHRMRCGSRLARALWIEIAYSYSHFTVFPGRGSREPCGLKFLRTCAIGGRSKSRLARALWIEICTPANNQRNFLVEARESLVD